MMDKLQRYSVTGRFIRLSGNGVPQSGMLEPVREVEHEVYLASDADETLLKLTTAEDALQRHGYRKSCDIPACNCGDQWNHGGHAVERLRELADVLHENGKTPLEVAKGLVFKLRTRTLALERIIEAWDGDSGSMHDDPAEIAREALNE